MAPTRTSRRSSANFSFDDVNVEEQRQAYLRYEQELKDLALARNLENELNWGPNPANPAPPQNPPQPETVHIQVNRDNPQAQQQNLTGTIAPAGREGTGVQVAAVAPDPTSAATGSQGQPTPQNAQNQPTIRAAAGREGYGGHVDVLPAVLARNLPSQGINENAITLDDDESEVKLSDSFEAAPSNQPSTSQGTSNHAARVGSPIGARGECTVCFETPVDPQGCNRCMNVIGCKTCVQRWHRSSTQPSCPLCRRRWIATPDVSPMEIIKSRRQSFRLRQIRATRRSHSRQPY